MYLHSEMLTFIFSSTAHDSFPQILGILGLHWLCRLTKGFMVVAILSPEKQKSILNH